VKCYENFPRKIKKTTKRYKETVSPKLIGREETLRWVMIKNEENHMNKNEFISQIAESADISKKSAGDTLQAFMVAITDTMKKGDKLTLIGFGTFSVYERAARTGRNPQTGKKMNIPAKKVVKFKVGKKLAEAVN
jgi:DNA-binding protein HU-beta